MSEKKDDYKSRGYLLEEEIIDVPTVEDMKKGAVPVIEDPEEIPCDSCAYYCPSGAITMDTLTSVPRVNYDKCIHCTICAQVCPGLAIFLVDKSRSPENKTWVTVPHELLPVPKKGDVVKILNRVGKVLGEAPVVRVLKSPKAAGTYLVTVEVDDELAMKVRAVLAK